MAERKSLGDLIVEVPQLVKNLLVAEIDNLKTEVKGHVSKLGAGAGLLAGAGFFAVFLLGWLLFAGFEALKLVVDPWLAALLVCAFLLLVVLILVAIGVPLAKRGADFKSMQSVNSIKDDVNVVRGLGHAADGTDPLDDVRDVTPDPTQHGGAR